MNWSVQKQSVLVPYDFSSASDEAVQVACSFVDTPGKVAVLHAVEPMNPYVTLADERNQEAQAHLEQTLQKLRKAMDDQGHTEVSVHVRFGEAPRSVAEYVQEHDVELLVMPSARRRGVKRLLLGSVAEQILRAVPCPVLVLRASET